MTRRLLLLFTLVLALPAPAAAFTLDLPPLPEPRVPAEALFACIDSLDAERERATGRERAELACALGLAWAATGAAKHLDRAQGCFDEATLLDPDATDAAWWSAIVWMRAGYPGAARRRMEAEVGRHPGDVEPLRRLALLEFVAARSHPHAREMSAAYNLWIAVLRRDQETPASLVGAGATALLVGNYELARSCGRRLQARAPELAEGWFIGAVGEFRLGNADASWPAFLRAISLGDEAERDAFLGGAELVRDEDLVAVARRTLPASRALAVPGARREDGTPDWTVALGDPGVRSTALERWWAERDPSPAAFANEAELEFWSRLVEADLLFGAPARGVRGWETAPGEVWVRLGKPLHSSASLSSGRDDPEFRTAPRPGESPGRGRLMGFEGPERVWDWAYRIRGRMVNVQFTDSTYGSPVWAIGRGSELDLGVVRNETPFVTSVARRDPRDLTVHAKAAWFPRGASALLETAVAIHPAQTGPVRFADTDSLILEWFLEDAGGDPLDESRRILGNDQRLGSLLRRSGREAGSAGSDPWVALVSAQVSAGAYGIRVRVTDGGSGRFSEKSFRVAIPPMPAGQTIALSSLQLSHGLPSWDLSDRVPPEFVKSGRVVIAAADAVIAGDRLGVYYEVLNPSTGPSGEARLDVEYAIYEATGEVRLASMLGTFDPRELEEVEHTTVQYLSERTGVSADGRVVKGTEIDVSALRAGDYVLRVLVTDSFTGRQCSAAAAFRRAAGAKSN